MLQGQIRPLAARSRSRSLAARSRTRPLAAQSRSRPLVARSRTRPLAVQSSLSLIRPLADSLAAPVLIRLRLAESPGGPWANGANSRQRL